MQCAKTGLRCGEGRRMILRDARDFRAFEME
jgi:hypothetical protein